MKKVHLLCNAHLDPAWLWRWNEGLAEALSTFRVAASFCEEYDGFIFNHNESLLYEWVEEYEPELFERIKKLVAAGKWHIMGGWYLQPDCNMPSAESFISQIEIGREYFKEKFGVTVNTAINFDSFGHTKGLVQILKKCGFDNYIIMRSTGFKGNFNWEGYDGSRILVHGVVGPYSSAKGEVLRRINECIAESKDDVMLCLWGVGNHGGGPSRIDIEDIAEYAKTSEHEILHSYVENYFNDVDKSNLPTVDHSLVPLMVGCYTSMCRIKQANRRVENKIAVAEKIMSYAAMQSDFKFDFEELQKAKKSLAFCQFHDILPGSGIKSVEEDGLKTLSYAEEITDKLSNKAFLKLCEGQKAAEDGTIPILVFNPHPYEIEDDFEVGFMLQNQNWNEDEVTLVTVYDENGDKIACQNEKPDCTFNLDWIEKVSFHGKIAPSSISRFNCKMTVHKKDDLPEKKEYSDVINISNDRMSFSIDRKTGRISEYTIAGKTLIKNSGVLEVYKDNEDPWGMTVNSFSNFKSKFNLMSDEAANNFVGYPDEATPNVRVVEDGDVRIKIQSFWEYKSNKAMIEYTIPKNDVYVNVKVVIHSSEPNVMIKYRLDTEFAGAPVGQQPFGAEELFADGKECVFQKWCGIKKDTEGLCIVNNGIYGGSFSENSIKLSLLRTPVYAAHPIYDRQIAPHNRFLDHIDMGERTFKFKLTTFEDCERKAQVFNEEPQIISFFPSGSGKAKSVSVKIDNSSVLLSSIRKSRDGYVATIYNASDKEQTATIEFPNLGKKIYETFGKYEFKFVNI